jgi:bifunctional ADP-heptose synthase (sugar kinase/adenylyltransferase)
MYNSNSSFITDYLLDNLRGKFKILVDPKGNNLLKFMDFYFIKPNLNEFNILNNSKLKYNNLELGIKI